MRELIFIPDIGDLLFGVITALVISVLFREKTSRKIRRRILFLALGISLFIHGGAFLVNAEEGREAMELFHTLGASISLLFFLNSYTAMMETSAWFAGSILLQLLYVIAFYLSMVVFFGYMLNIFGRNLVGYLRNLLARCDRVFLLYGDHIDAEHYAMSIMKNKHDRVVYAYTPGVFTGEEDVKVADAINWPAERIMGAGDGLWLDMIGIRKDNSRPLYVLCFTRDEERAAAFTDCVLRGLGEKGIEEGRYKILVLTHEDALNG